MNPKTTNKPNTLAWGLVGFLVILAAIGWTKVHFNPNILAVFPKNIPEVQALEDYQTHFEKGGRVILVIKDNENIRGRETSFEAHTEQLANHLIESKVCSKVIWRPLWEYDRDALAEIIAYLHINSEPEHLRKIGLHANKENLLDTLSLHQEDLAFQMDNTSILLDSKDPLSFFKHPVFKNMRTSDSANPFISEDETHRLLILYPPADRESAPKWVKKLHSEISLFNSDSYRATGGPVFAAEIASNIKNDLRYTIALTIIGCSLLFWLLLRKNILVHWLTAMLVLILSITVGIGALVLDQMSLMSVGFASILIGLAVDYGMIICQEMKMHGRNPHLFYKAIRQSIIWASLSTSMVFASLCLSSLPGVQELGALVSIGILVSAVIMLKIYIPIARKYVVTPGALANTQNTPEGNNLTKNKTGKAIRFVTYGLATLALIAVISHHIAKPLPKLSFDLAITQPKHSHAQSTLHLIEKKFPHKNSQPTKAIITAQSDSEMITRLQEIDLLVSNHADMRLTQRGLSPIDFWPNRMHQKNNQETSNLLWKDKQRILDTLKALGYRGDAITLTASVIDHMHRFTSNTSKASSAYPSSLGAREVLDMSINIDHKTALLEVSPIHKNSNTDFLNAIHSLNSENTQITGWQHVSSAIQPHIAKDASHVFLPMCGVLLILLSVVFRHWKDVFIGSLCLMMPLAILNMFVYYSEYEWNFLNIIAIPLLLGMGIDYVIHMIFSLRRHNGNMAHVRCGIGKALFFCGMTTATGFGSLLIASNQALTSMGAICSLGMLLVMITCIYLLPRLWKLLHRL